MEPRKTYALGHGKSADPRSWTMVIVPYVIKPTRAFGGRRLKLTTSVSRRAFNSSSSRHVSTTNMKMGGTGAGRDKVYSIVVYAGESSLGRFVAVMSL